MAYMALNMKNINNYRGFSRHCAHSIAQVVTTMAAMLDIFLCSTTRKRIAEIVVFVCNSLFGFIFHV